MKTNVFAIYCILFWRVQTFLPSKENTDGRTEYTHASITEAALYYAVADFISNVIHPGKYNSSDPDGTIITYFKRDKLVNFGELVMDIVNKNNMAQKDYMDDASRTMNCEEIDAGHQLLQSLRDNIIRQSETTMPNWDAVRDLIGQYLFTLQEFYSNTNWIEMFGNRVCQELGVSGRALPLEISTADMVTCISCNYSKEAVQEFSCVDNMRSDGHILTSGYTSYQQINKPIGMFPSGMGKCSHGGQRDSSKDIPATGGINKETTNPNLSPHFDLHEQAGEAAIRASIEFLIGNGTGLLRILGVNKFKQLMGMNYRSPCYNCMAPGLSVVFVMDDTGSMSDEIREVTQHGIDIVNRVVLLGSDGPSKFILSTFNDPETTTRQTTNGTEMKLWLHAMRAHGGGDCPEMALTGLINALKIANHGSCVFFFTDADAKDAKRKDEVINLINSKSIRVVFFLRGQCGRRRRRSTFSVPENIKCISNQESETRERKRRGLGGFDLFDKIAAATGAQIVHTSSSSLGSILGSFVKENMGVTTLEVSSFEMSSGSQHSIAVDTDLSLMTIRIEGLSSATRVSLNRPDGTRQIFSGNSSVDVIGSTTVISVQNPAPGIWILHKNGPGTWKVKVGGSGNIDFSYRLMENVHGLRYPISGTSPITGTKIIISITVNGLPATANVTSIILKKPDGSVLHVLPVTDTYNSSSRVLYSNYLVTSKQFFVSINGSLSSKMFTREKSNVITPVTGSIQFSSKPEKLVLGKSTAVKVNITNAGGTTQTFQVTAASVPTGFVSSSSHTIPVTGHKSREINIQVTGHSVTLVLLTVTLNIGGTTLQTIKRTLEVADVEPPQIRKMNKTVDCKRNMMNYFNCTHQQWTIVMDIDFKVNMSKLFATPSNVNFTYNKSASTSYVATLSGTCCSYLSRVTAIDVQGNMRSESFDFSGGNVFNTTVDNFDLLVRPNPFVGKKKLSSNVDQVLFYGLIGGGIGGLGIIAGIVATLIYINKTQRQSKEINRLDSLSSPCFDAPIKHVERNSRSKFVMRT